MQEERTRSSQLETQGHGVQSRITELESEKASLSRLAERKSQIVDRAEEEYKELQEKYAELRRQLVNVENEMQQVQNTNMSLKFKEQSLTQELDLLKKNNDFTSAELTKSLADFSSFRKEKSRELTSLHTELDEKIAESASLQSSSNALRQRLEEQTQTLEAQLVRLQENHDRLVTQEESFRSELDSQQRLTQLWQQSTEEGKRHIKELEDFLHSVESKAAQETKKWIAEATSETERAAQAEIRIGELEAEVGRLDGELQTLKQTYQPVTSSPGTPINGVGLLSPAFSKTSLGGKSLTQLYSDYLAVKNELEHEKRRNAKIQENFDDLIQDLEIRAPQIQQQRSEYQQAQAELAEMSFILQESIEEREKLTNQLKHGSSHVQDLERECKIYQQQTKDLGRQIQHLLRELEDAKSGAEPLSGAELAALRRLTESDEGVELSDTDVLITERLTVYRNIQELQQQNQSLLKVTRQLGDKMEREEQEFRARMDSLESIAVKKAEETIEQLKSELQSTSIKTNSYIRERDMFRRLMASNSVEQSAVEMHGQSEIPDATANETDYVGLLRELQSQFDVYRNEMTIDVRTLNNQIRQLTHERSDANVQIAKSKGQIELVNERHHLALSNLEMAKSENEELRKRLSSLQNTISQQDVRTQDVVEELIEVKSLLESVKTENMNLKSEKQLHKTIESRLTTDNESLLQEKGRLGALLSNIQTMQGESERRESESRNRLLSQVESLEHEAQALRAKLEEQSNEARQNSLRYETENKQWQELQSKSQAELSNVKEEFSSVQATNTYHVARISELTILLQQANDKLEVYMKPSAAKENNVQVEQSLRIEVAELKSSLQLAQTEAENAQNATTQMKEISNSAEEALQTMNQSYDQFKASVDKQNEEQQVR